MAARGFSVLQRTIIPCANVSGSSSNGSAFWAFPKKGISSCARMRGGVGRTRTNHQSVMECRGVRPAHVVGHQALELEEGRHAWCDRPAHPSGGRPKYRNAEI